LDDSFVWLKPTQTEGKDQCNTAVLASGDASGHLSDHQKSRKFSVLSVPLVTNRHSQWTVKIRQKKFAKYTMTEWENKTKSTSIQVSRRGPNPWRVFFNGINYGKIISPPSNIQQEKVPLNQRGPLKKMIHPYQLCKYQRFIKKSLQWFFWIFEIFLKPKYWVQTVL